LTSLLSVHVESCAAVPSIELSAKMKLLMSATLITFGALWIFHATLVPSVMRNRAMSNAMELETNLKRWTNEKVYDGKFKDSDVLGIFPEGSALRFGGENPKKIFREMIAEIAQSRAPPTWPGVFAVLIGGAGAVSCFRARKSRQGSPQVGGGNGG
jgi:hypothetical protein